MRNEAGDAHISLRTELIDYTDGEEVFEAYVSIPNGIAGRSATVLLAHEWSGLNEGMRRVANRIAEIGYVCFAMDVYGKGIRGDQAGDNSHLMMPLIRDRRLLRQRLLAGLRAATHILLSTHPESPHSDIVLAASVPLTLGALFLLSLAAW
jgi:dienelactone hydrolase